MTYIKFDLLHLFYEVHNEEEFEDTKWVIRK
jgi:hypothetical protein